MDSIEITLDQLRGLIGVCVHHNGVDCCIIEVLEDGPTLVLMDAELHTTIQEDQFGSAHRRVVETFTIPVLSHDGGHLHPDFLELDLLHLE